MKKNFLWMAAAIMTCGLAFTACAVDDNPNPDPTYPFDVEEYWNKTTSVMDFEDEDVSMFTNVNPNRMAITAAEDASMGKVAKFQCTNRNALPLGLYSFREMADKANKVIFEFDFNMGSVSGHHKITIGDADVHNATSGGFNVTSKNNYGYGPNGAIFQFGTDRGGGENYFKINDSIAANKDAAYAANDVLGQWMHAKVVVNVDDRLVSYEMSKDGELMFKGDNLPFYNEQAQKCNQFDISFSNTGVSYIDNLSIVTAVNPDIKYADYTVRFVDPDGNEIKEARSGNGRVGSFVKLLESDKTPIYNAENTIKWVYDSDDAAEVAVAEANTVITVKFKESEKYAWRLRQYFNDGNGANGTRIGTEWIEGEQFVGDTYTVFYQLAYKHPTDGKWYVAPKVGSYEGRSYTFTGNESTNAAGTIHLMDVKYEKIDSIVWIGEFEDQTAMTLVGEVETWIGWTDIATAGNRFDRFSNGAGPRLKEGSYFIINDAFEAGTYKIFIYGRNGGSEANQYALYYIPAEGGDPVKLEVEIPEAAGGQMFGHTIENVAIPAGAKLVIKNDGMANYLDLDHISICKQPAAE